LGGAIVIGLALLILKKKPPIEMVFNPLICKAEMKARHEAGFIAFKLYRFIDDFELMKGIL
jgi:hypothetical protein